MDCNKIIFKYLGTVERSWHSQESEALNTDWLELWSLSSSKNKHSGIKYQFPHIFSRDTGLYFKDPHNF